MDRLRTPYFNANARIEIDYVLAPAAYLNLAPWSATRSAIRDRMSKVDASDAEIQLRGVRDA